LNILILCLSPGKGGLELYANRSIELVEELGHKCVTVSSPDSEIFNCHHNRACDRSVYSLKTAFHLLPFFSAFKLARIIDSNNIDLIIIHWSRDFNIAVLAKILSSRNVKLIYTRHMAITRYKNTYYHQFLYSQVDRFVVITKQLRKEAVKFLPITDSKIKLLYHGLNKSTLAFNSNRISCDKFRVNAISEKYLHVAIFSRIEEAKGHHLLVEAVNKLRIKNKEIHVTIVGHIMCHEYYKKLKKSIHDYQLDSQFHFHEFIEHASSFMTCFDIIVLTTYAETFGLVLIEAMQSGVAVIGSNAGGVPEIINDKVTGLLFKTKDVESLSKKIEFYYDNPDSRKEIAKQGQQFVEIDFSDEQHKKALSDILESI